MNKNQMAYCMYVIGTVESNLRWDAYGDPGDTMTFGMMQCALSECGTLIGKLHDQDPDDYNKLSSRIKNLYESGYDWSRWTLHYAADDASWVDAAQSDANHKVQLNYWYEQEPEQEEELIRWGADMSDPKRVIFLVSIHHQSPQACLQIMNAIPPTSNIDTIHAAALNNRIVGRYKNRQNTVYKLLQEWDGVSAPPDFGGIIDGTNPGTIPSDPNTGGNATKSPLHYVALTPGGNLTVHGDFNGQSQVQCYYTGNNIWYPSAGSIPNVAPPNTTPGSSSGTPQDFLKMKELWENNEMHFAYAQQPGRLDPINSGITDCSGCIWWAVNAIRPDIGSWLGTSTYTMVDTITNVVEEGTDGILDISRMQPGDIVICKWAKWSGQHAMWYWGNNILWEMNTGGGPTKARGDATTHLQGLVTWYKVLRIF